MTHSDFVSKFLQGEGVEIGAFKSPVPGISPYYIDKYQTYANEPCLADHYGEAVDLPFRSNSLDYIVSSHVLEHVANPVLALAEWYRVLRPGGIIYMIVPDRRYTWDHSRELTSIEHLLSDYLLKTTPVDPTHIDDFVNNVDWSTFSPDTPAQEVLSEKAKRREIYHAAVNAGEEVNIHFHVFEPANIIGLIERLKNFKAFPFLWRVEAVQERFPQENPNGILAIVRVKKSLRDKLQSLTEKLTRGLFNRSPLRAGAGAFPKKA